MNRKEANLDDSGVLCGFLDVDDSLLSFGR